MSPDLKVVMEWVEKRLQMGDVPRIIDAISYAKSNNLKVKRKDIVGQLELNLSFMFNLEQKRIKPNSNKFRPILGLSLGTLHSDIGFFTKSKNYSTPVTYQSGYLVARDVLSKYTYVVILRGNRRANSIISAFQKILDLHKAAGRDYAIRSVAFDKETSVLSNAVQLFFQQNNITFVAFKNSASKSKVAENCIRQIRTITARLIRHSKNTARWWNVLPKVVKILNSRQIYVNGKPTGFKPEQINSNNLGQYIEMVYKLSPANFFAQFSLDPRLVKFKFEVGSFVRAKLLITSSAVIGEKRSETNLTRQSFGIVEQIPYITKDLSIGLGYKCINLKTGESEIFDENDLKLTVPEYESLYSI